MTRGPAPRRDEDDADAAPDAWDLAAAWLARHGALPAVGVVTVMMCAIYAGVFRGELAGDDLTFHLAESARLADCIRHGDWDLWNPSANGGFASAYYYQVLPQFASALPAALFGHHLFWFQLTIFLPLVLAPAAAYRGMRLMGAMPWQAAIAAFVIGFTIGASRWGFGADGTFSVGLYTQTWALAAFPLALGHAVRWLVERESLAPAIAWGTFVGLCHPFGGVSLALALAIGVIGVVLADRTTWRSPVLGGAVLVLLGLLAAAVWFVLARGRPAYLAPAVALIVGGGVQLGRGVRKRDPRWRADLWIVFGPPVRLVLIGLALGLATMPGWITMLVDSEGFGGFPHRVNDEVGPGFTQLWKWYSSGAILDHGRGLVLTVALPIVIVFGRATLLRWVWAPALAFALLLGLGPHMPKTADDLIPAVRFLGAMQIMLALAIGAGVYSILKRLWHARAGTWTWDTARYALFAVVVVGGPGLAVYLGWFAPDRSALLRVLQRLSFSTIDDLRTLRIIGMIVIVVGAAAAARPVWQALTTEFGIRTGISAAVAALVVLVVVPGAQVQRSRVRVLADYPGSHREEMLPIITTLASQPPGRKQVGPGCENHWWNLLSYVYGRVPATLQMGGGGLQASPNYDFLWSVRDQVKTAWIYDAPYLVFDKAKANTQPLGETVIETGTYLVRRLPSPGLVSPIQITGVLPEGPTGQNTEVRKAALAWARTKMPLENRHLVYAGHGLAGVAPAGEVRRAWRQPSPGDAADIVAQVDVEEPTTFVIRESWHPRWRAYLDGKPVALRRVTPDFPAVDVPAGTHVIQLRFERPWWAHASWLAWPVVVMLAWFGTRWARRRRARRAVAAHPEDLGA